MKKSTPANDTLLEKATVALMVGALDAASKMLSVEQPVSEIEEAQEEESFENGSQHYRKPR